MTLRYELSRGLAYRKIRHPEMRWYTTTLPLISTIVIYIACLAIPRAIPLLGEAGILASSLSILSTLPGFYFAGLAAVATFNGTNMDSVMPSPPPTLEVRLGNHREEIDLSRRQFLSYLFSYLVILSFTICVAIVALNAVEPSISMVEKATQAAWWLAITWAFIEQLGVLALLLALCSMVITTLHGVYFLAERIHQP